MWAIFDRYSGQQVGKEYPHREQAWTEAYERKLVMNGRLGERGQYLDMLHPTYEIKAVSAAE